MTFPPSADRIFCFTRNAHTAVISIVSIQHSNAIISVWCWLQLEHFVTKAAIYIYIYTLSDKNSADKNFRRTKVPKFRVGAENFVRRKVLSAENFVRRKCFWMTFGGQNCRNFDLVPKILSAENFCPPKILSAEFLSDKVYFGRTLGHYRRTLSDVRRLFPGLVKVPLS